MSLKGLINVKTYLVGKSVAILLHSKKIISKHPVLYHTEENGQILNGLRVAVFCGASSPFESVDYPCRDESLDSSVLFCKLPL